MTKALENVSFEERWKIATKALTGATHTESEALLNALGQEKYNEVMGAIWEEQGRACRELVESLGMTITSPRSVAEAQEAVVELTMGPELAMEITEDTPNRAVARCLECTWYNRQKELGLKGDICLVPDPAFCNGLAKSFNPKLSVKLTKSMPQGDEYCEWVYELQA